MVMVGMVYGWKGGIMERWNDGKVEGWIVMGEMVYGWKGGMMERWKGGW